MKKLFQFLSLALTSVSLLLPSASALRPVSESDLERFMDREFASSYAEEAYRDYERLQSEGDLNGLKILKIRIGDMLRWLTETDPQLGVCLTVQLIKLFTPDANSSVFVELPAGSTDRYNPNLYNKECCIISAPSFKFRDLPVIVQLFQGKYVSLSLKIN